MELWGCFVVAAVSCELFYGNAWRFQLESGRCLDRENIPTIGVGEGERGKEDGAHSQTCLQQGQDQEQLSCLFSSLHAAKPHIFIN